MSKTLGTLLVLAVTVVLLSLLFTGNQGLMDTLSVTIILVTMILVIGGASNQLPGVLRIILSEIRRIIRP
jgi:hypothetical protein